jgi:hypothetical protein
VDKIMHTTPETFVRGLKPKIENVVDMGDTDSGTTVSLRDIMIRDARRHTQLIDIMPDETPAPSTETTAIVAAELTPLPPLVAPVGVFGDAPAEPTIGAHRGMMDRTIDDLGKTLEHLVAEKAIIVLELAEVNGDIASLQDVIGKLKNRGEKPS